MEGASKGVHGGVSFVSLFGQCVVAIPLFAVECDARGVVGRKFGLPSIAQRVLFLSLPLSRVTCFVDVGVP